MSDRFDFLEIGDTRPRTLPQPADSTAESAHVWKPQRLRAVEVIGEPGAGAGQFSAPTGLAVDPWGSLYIADSNNHRVQRITPGGDVYVYGRPGNTVGQMWGPMAVAVHPSGQFFFVAEQGSHRVQCFQYTGQPRGAVGGFRGPSGVAFDAEGMLWIADTGNARVLLLHVGSGQFVNGNGLDRKVGIQQPISVACDHANNIYVTDGGAEDVLCYNRSGVRLRAFGENRRLALPRQVAVDRQGRVYMMESSANRLHVFTPQGDSLATFETPGSRLGPLRSPSGVALGPNGEIYIADTLNHRILRLAWE